MDRSQTVIVSARRTPVGTFNGMFRTLQARDLGAAAIRGVLQEPDLDPSIVDEVILGHVLTGGAGQHPARRAALMAGLPVEVVAASVNRVCGSGLYAIGLADLTIRSGQSSVVVAGGMESMSRAPYLLPKAREGYRFGHETLVDSMIFDGLWDVSGDIHMGITAENVADRFGISREEQDAFALGSQMKCKAALEQNRFADEIVPVEVPQKRKPPVLVDKDEFPKPQTTAEALAALRPAFKKDGTVTAGNASGLNDGAAVVVAMSAEEAKRRGLEPLVRIRAWASAGTDPSFMGLGPVSATHKVLDRAGLSLDDIDLLEYNEAFAAQALGVRYELQWNDDKVNVNGGAIAIGHPIGASGGRIMVSLVHEMQKRDARLGLASLCIGGGEGVAMIVER